MSTAKRNWTAGFCTSFYWIGVAMSLATFVLVLAGNTELVSRFEHTGFPLSWACAGVAVIAFLAAEFCDFAFSMPREANNKSRQLSSELETAES